MTQLDETKPVRPGEELDVEPLDAYLRGRLAHSSGPLVVEQFPHGHSNLTYLLRYSDKEYVLRRPPFGNQVKTAHDMGREYRVLSKLCEVYPPAPRPFLYCEDLTIIGAPFYLMERRRGVIFRRALPAGTPLEPRLLTRLCLALVDNLAELHSIDYQAAGLGDLGKPEGYVARQISGWTKRYRDAETDAVRDIEHLADWLNRNQPAEGGAAVIHNDYKFDNLLFDANSLTKIIAVFDWEMATIGDPLMDLGSTLGYWVQADDPEEIRQAAFGPTYMPGSLTRRELADRYARTSGLDITNMLFYYCYGLFKIAVIIQQIYARYARGHTCDARFATMNQMVVVLCQQATRALETGTY